MATGGKTSAFLALVLLAVTAGAAQAGRVVVLPPGGGPHVRIFDANGADRGGFFAYPGGFDGGVKVAAGDVDGAGGEEIITGAGPGGGPHVRVVHHNGSDYGSFYAYAAGFATGVRVASGDVDGDGDDEVLTAPGFGGGPHVRIFDGTGRELGGFMAYDSRFTGGISIAAGDIDGDGRDEIITGPGFTGGPHVRVFDPFGTERTGFLAYHPSLTTGINVAAADVNGDGRDEIITAPARGGGPHVRVFGANGAERFGFMAYHPGFLGGVTVAGGNVDGTDADEVITGAGYGGGPHVRIIGDGGGMRSEFFAYPGYVGGVNVATARPSAAGLARVVTGAGIEYYEEELRPGDRGPAVVRLQQGLTDRGFWVGPSDGTYGYTTEQAVFAFQKFVGLPRTGAADVRTQAALARTGRPTPRSGSGDVIEVDKTRQLIFVVRGGRTLWVFNTSTGSGRPYTYAGNTYISHTPEGRFRVERQINGTRVSHLGQLYRPKYFHGGYAIHGSPSVPPQPASHGCVRLSNPAMNYVWDAGLMPIGMPVWVYR